MTKPCSPQEVMRIRQLYAEGWSQGRLAREFKRTVGTIGRIVRGETHQTLPTIESAIDIEVKAVEAQRRFLEMQEKREGETLKKFKEDLDAAITLENTLKDLKGE